MKQAPFVSVAVATAAILLLSTSAAAASREVPSWQKTRTSRYRQPTGCPADDTCPEHLGTFHFSQLEAMLPPAAPEVFLKEAAAPMISRVYAVSDDDGRHISHWQLRTVTVQPEPRGMMPPARERGERHIVMPFMLDTVAPHVHLGKKAFNHLLGAGALEGEVHLGLCNVRIPLPHADVRCARAFGPSKLSPTNDERKNVLGGAAAVTILAVQTAFDVADARGDFQPCRMGDAAGCDKAMAAVAQHLMAKDATLRAILSSIIPKDTASQLAVEVTVNAVREERREAMLEGIKRELSLLLDAPANPDFVAAEFLKPRKTSTPPTETKAKPTAATKASSGGADDDEGEF